MCGLEAVADASVGTLGIEHRKRTTIGVELAAKPKLLLFLDEVRFFFFVFYLISQASLRSLHPVLTRRARGRSCCSFSSSRPTDKPFFARTFRHYHFLARC
jgi:hypothetical protein